MTLDRMLIFGYTFFAIYSAAKLYLLNNMFETMKTASIQKSEDVVREPLNKAQNVALLFSLSDIRQLLMDALEIRPISLVFSRKIAVYEAKASHLGGLNPQQILSFQKNIG